MSEEIVAVEFSSVLRPAIIELRREVFVNEQGVPIELEVDHYDEGALHLAALRDGKVIGTLRMIFCGDIVRVGRLAVRSEERRYGCGSRLMQRAAAIASERGAREIVLHAQISAMGFYRLFGYTEEGDAFDDAGIQHIMMRKRIGLPSLAVSEQSEP